MRIERWLTVVALVSAGSVAASGPERAPDRDTTGVRIVRSTELHPRSQLRGVCHAGREVNGCTDFPVETLECQCVRSEGGWMMKPKVELHAVTHLRRASQHARLLAHEELHIIDLTTGLRKYLGSLMARRFASAESCRLAAWSVSGSGHLKAVMNKLRIESNEKYGCSKGHS